MWEIFTVIHIFSSHKIIKPIITHKKKIHSETPILTILFHESTQSKHREQFFVNPLIAEPLFKSHFFTSVNSNFACNAITEDWHINEKFFNTPFCSKFCLLGKFRLFFDDFFCGKLYGACKQPLSTDRYTIFRYLWG